MNSEYVLRFLQCEMSVCLEVFYVNEQFYISPATTTSNISENIKYSYSQVGSGPHGEAALMIIMLLSQISLTFSSGKIPKCLNQIDAKGQRLLI